MLVGDLHPKRDFTDVRDVVRAYDCILELPKRAPIYNVSSGHAISIRELLETMLQLSGLEVALQTDAARLRRNEIPIVTGDSSAVRRDTGWSPVIPLEQTLGDLLAYWKARVQATK